MAEPARCHTGRSEALAWALLIAVLLLGVASRLPRLDEPPLGYHATRQYHSALLARDFLADVDPDAVDVSPEVVERTRLPLIEPPIVEVLATGGFVITGGQSWWLPRSLSLAFWAGAAVVVFLIGRRGHNLITGVVAAAVMMLNPGTTEVARSFQPESLLVLAIALAALLLLRGTEEDASRAICRWAALAVGLAIAVKITAALVLLPLGILTAIVWWRRVGVSELLIRSLLAALLTSLYYAYGFFWGDFLSDQAGGRILPQLLTQHGFWTGWGTTATVIAPVGLMAAGVAGTLVAGPRLRRLVSALLVGYLLLGVTFTHHISTHDYYSAPLIVPMALGVGAGTDWVLTRLGSAPLRQVAAGVLLLLAVVAFAEQLVIARRVPSSVKEVTVSQEIGAAMPKGARAVAVASHYGYLLRFYGGLPVASWPYRVDLQYEEEQGIAPISARERLDELAADDVDYFVVANEIELDRQPSLKRLLSGLPVYAQGPGWRVYELDHTTRPAPIPIEGNRSRQARRRSEGPGWPRHEGGRT